MALYDGKIRKLLDRIHGIIAADIDEHLDVQLIQDAEDLLIDIRVLVDIRQLKTAGT